MRRRRILKWAKWASTLAAGLAVGVMVFGVLYRCTWKAVTGDGSGVRNIAICEGAVRVVDIYGLSKSELPRHASWTLERSSGWAWGPWTWRAGTYGERIFHAGFQCWRDQYTWNFGLSLLYPVLLTTIPAAFLWYKDRRRFGRHACQKCGYDRRGLPAEAKCPECGTTPARG
jgi:hypothetical protein